VNGAPAEPAALRVPSPAARREALLRRLGLEPSTGDVVRYFLDAALPAQGARVLDAGCGRVSALTPFRGRIAEFVGVDIHEPDPLPSWIDRFVLADLCREADAFPEATFDVVLSSFTVEHFADPPAAFGTLRGWLRPGGSIVVTTVNRGHPFVNAYLLMPRFVGRPLQRFVKASAADAHPLVGACNTPPALRDALATAGFTEIELVTTDHLARAWSRRLPAYVGGLIGDLAAHGVPARRSTIVARAVRPG
jgi:SAM-dependent methyltransferase